MSLQNKAEVIQTKKEKQLYWGEKKERKQFQAFS